LASAHQPVYHSSTPVCLVVPPGGVLGYPSLALPNLKGYLKASGIGAQLQDFNLPAFEYVSSRPNVDLLLERLARSEKKLRRQYLNEGDSTRVEMLDFFLDIPDASRIHLSNVADRLRDKNVFLHETAYFLTLHHLGVLTNLVELVFSPLRFTPGSLVGGMFSSVRNFHDLLTIETPYDQFIMHELSLLDQKCSLIGFSAFSYDQLVMSMRMSPMIRESNPGAILVLGGNCLCESEVPRSLMYELASRFDFVVSGDGELPLLRILEFLDGKRSKDLIPNAAYIEDGQLINNGGSYKYRFEKGTRPDFSGFPMDDYLLPEPVLPFRFSNGCEYGRCTFCAESADRGPMSSRLNYREIESNLLANHFAELQEKWGASIFMNCSSLLTAEGASKIGQAVAERNLAVQWYAMVRNEKPWTDKNIACAGAGGGSTLGFGVESFNRRVNHAMRKGINVKQAPKIMKSFKELGVTNNIYTMVNFPSETLEEYCEHLQALKNHFADSFDIIFQSRFLLVVDAPELDRQLEELPDTVQETLKALRSEPFPIYLVPDQKTGSPAFRMPGDRFEEKIDHYYKMLLSLAFQEPLYFDRDFEITSRTFFWEPEYLMIVKNSPDKRFLRGYSYRDLLDSELFLSENISIQHNRSGQIVIQDPRRGIFLQLGILTSFVIANHVSGQRLFPIFKKILEEFDPTAKELLELYQDIHCSLRQLQILMTHSDRSDTSEFPAESFLVIREFGDMQTAINQASLSS